MTSSVGRTTSCAGPSGFASRSRSTATARRPISKAGWATTVRNGKVTIASGRSSKPTRATSSGTRSPSSASACWTPIAMKLLAANSAVGRGTCAIAARAMARPLSIVNAPCSTAGARQAGLVHERPRKPATRSTAVGTVAGPDSTAMWRCPRPTSSRPSSSAPPSESARTTSAPPACGRRSTTTSGTPRSRHSADGLLAGAGRDDQEAVDLALEQHRDQAPLLVLALVAVGEEQRDARLARGRLDALGERREERVRHVGQQERDRVGPLVPGGCGRGCWACSPSRRAPARRARAAPG